MHVFWGDHAAHVLDGEPVQARFDERLRSSALVVVIEMRRHVPQITCPVNLARDVGLTYAGRGDRGMVL